MEIANSQGFDYKTGCLRDYPDFKEQYKMIATDLSKQQALNADLKANYFYWKSSSKGSKVFYHCRSKHKVKKTTVLNFSQGTITVLLILFCFNIILI